jgi:acetate kinase
MSPTTISRARVLCVNLGSRSAKLTLLDVPSGAQLGEPGAAVAETEAALEAMSDRATLAPFEATPVDAVAYRVVRIRRLPAADAVPFDDATRASILAAAEFAPLHTRSVVAAYDALRAALPGARHVAVFDAAFHRTIPPRAAAYGLPYDDFTAGWRKVGFHGLSHAYATARSAVLLGDARPSRKLVSVHLGGGCSIAAIDGARSLDTTMGFTPQDGLLMATRSGTLDAGMLLAYMREKRLSIDDAERLISERSGLLGLGGSGDMREILAARARGDERAVLAYDVFVYRTLVAAGAAAATLGGLEALAFLGGIGENAPEVRGDVCAGLAFLGVRADAARNGPSADDAVISPAGDAVPVLRIHTREDWAMALATAAA